jgi:hypothetical protein
VAKLGADRLTGKGQPFNAETAGDLQFAHLAPARIVKDEGQIDDPFIHRLCVGGDELSHEGQAGGA